MYLGIHVSWKPAEVHHEPQMEQDRGLGDFERGLVVCAENGPKKEKISSEQQLNVVLFHNIFDFFPCLG